MTHLLYRKIQDGKPLGHGWSSSLENETDRAVHAGQRQDDTITPLNGRRDDTAAESQTQTETTNKNTDIDSSSQRVTRSMLKKNAIIHPDHDMARRNVTPNKEPTTSGTTNIHLQRDYSQRNGKRD